MAHARWLITALVGGVAGLAPAAGAEPVYPAVRWAGTVADPALLAKAPAGGMVGTQKEFAALWKAWGLADPVPDVDFGGHFVVVVTAPGHSVSVSRANVGPDGNAFVLSTQLAGEKERPGFGYALGVFPRAMKTVGGKEIPK